MVVVARSLDVEALAEDHLTAWIPDPAGLVDAQAHLVEHHDSDAPPATWLRVPRPDGSGMVVPVLHPASHAALHRAVESIRDPLEQRLAAGVCGYRRGAEANGSYRSEYLRFSALVAQRALDADEVVFADIKDFFDSVSIASTAAAATRLLDDSAAGPLKHLAMSWGRYGLTSLPAGYADARMLANLILHEIEDEGMSEFARWVDDYRLFAGKNQRPQELLGNLEARLGSIGLQLNWAKTRIVKSERAELESRNSLSSVYHPDRDPPELVKQKLRRIWVAAIKDPVANRRAIRFALPRLAHERDDIAVSYAIAGLVATPWEAPRLVSYLRAFEGENRVSAAVDALFVSAVSAANAWLVARLAPLACRTGLSAKSASRVSDGISALATTPAWGSALRVLSYSGHEASVGRLATAGAPDSRAALAALRDVEIAPPDSLVEAEPITAECLRDRPAPLPSAASLL